tara:strand:- start:2591 stop:3826 length:1236 start_codon:yes stop_codon:yes gene_type:complete
MKKRIQILELLVFVFFSVSMYSQFSDVPENIKTIIFKSSNTNNSFLNYGEQFELSFDDLDSDEKNYYYQINHFDYKWSDSNLLKSEFLNGFDDLRITEHRNSFNTLQSFTHYKIKIPNEDVSIKISGNYSISIHLSNGEEVFEKKFSIISNTVPIKISISKSNIVKDIDTNQKIKTTILCENCTKLFNSASSLKMIIIKNNNWLNSQIIEKPKYILSDKLIYDDIEFNGGNEFLNFDNSNINSTNLRIYKTTLTDLYNNFLTKDKERTNSFYEYNPDINGEYVINSNTNFDIDIENDYARIFFNFKTDNYDLNKNIYLIGKFNDFIINENYKLLYDQKTKSYKGSFLFKQGFYNYKYAFNNKLNKKEVQYFEGNFWETENTYRVLLFHKKINDKYYKIIGTNVVSSINIKN